MDYYRPRLSQCHSTLGSLHRQRSRTTQDISHRRQKSSHTSSSKPSAAASDIEIDTEKLQRKQGQIAVPTRSRSRAKTLLEKLLEDDPARRLRLPFGVDSEHHIPGLLPRLLSEKQCGTCLQWKSNYQAASMHCDHDLKTCLDCMRMYIYQKFDEELPLHLACPTCSREMSGLDIELLCGVRLRARCRRIACY